MLNHAQDAWKGVAKFGERLDYTTLAQFGNIAAQSGMQNVAIAALRGLRQDG